MAPITPVQVPGTATPVGHYSQAVVHNDVVFVSGLLPLDLESGKPVPGTIEEQTERVLGNLERILRTSGSGLDRLLQVTIYLPRMDDWGAVNQVYARILGDHRPARAIVPVPALHFGVGIEIQAISGR